MAKKTKKLDLAAGVPAADLVDGAMISGRVGKEAVLLARAGDEIFAISAKCTHYGGPPPDGAGGEGRTAHGSRRVGRLISADQRALHLRRRRYRAVPVCPRRRRGGARRALGGGREARPGRGDQHARRAPFFWSQHYDVPINYVGHAGKWNTAEILGDIKEGDGLEKYRNGGRVVAVASIFRDEECLRAELDLERSN
jgi:hypothetical protein